MIERNRITGDPVIIAPERAGRPNLFRQETDPCPFCPGHESLTPREIWRDRDPWTIRVFPNKYPATERHEVIVESARHEDGFDQIDDAPAVVDTYVNRYNALAPDAAYVSIFKNHGPMAGATIPHLHSQILAVPFVPPRVAREGAAFGSSCPLCSLAGEPVFSDTPNYVTIAPRGSMFAHERWIVPKRHDCEIREPHELGQLLQESARALGPIADSFNWIFMNFPRQPRAHWYVQIFPRLGVHAGFELGSGSAINTVDGVGAGPPAGTRPA